jgi:acyl-CoA synthetase (NDP forming)
MPAQESPDILHKTESGVVSLSLQNAQDVGDAARLLFERGAPSFRHRASTDCWSNR